MTPRFDCHKLNEKDEDPELTRENVLEAKLLAQPAIDVVDEALMESFPASDPPGYTMCHA